MQKKLIALAVAGLVSVPAFAQSNVTIYGRMDAGLFNQDDDAGHAVTRVDSSGWTTSRLGFKGAESLGNGLQALFQVETTLVNDDETGLNGPGRDTFVGLGGGFGLKGVIFCWERRINKFIISIIIVWSGFCY